jgi:hypothetical protein
MKRVKVVLNLGEGRGNGKEMSTRERQVAKGSGNNWISLW